MRTSLLFFGIVVAAGLAARADEIVMTNGDRLTGTVVTLAAGKLVLKTAYAGTVTIDWNKVASVTTAKPIPVETASGDRFTASVAAAEPGRLKLTPADAARGELIILAGDISYMGKDAAAGPKWAGTLDVSFTSHYGNSEDAVLAARAALARESRTDAFTVKASYEYGEEAGIANLGRGLFGLRYDYRHRPKLFSWYELREEHDHFADIGLRTTCGAGVGFRIPAGESLTLDFRTGLTYVDTNNISPVVDESSAGTLTGLELKWNIAKGLDLLQVVTWEYGFDAGDHRIHAETTLRCKLNSRLSLRVSFIDDYDSDPAPGRDGNDVTIFAGIGFSF